MGLRALDQALGCLSVMVLPVAREIGGTVKMNEWSVFMGSCRHHGHHLVVRPEVLNLWAKLAADTVLKEYITRVRMDETLWRRKASGRCMSRER